MGGRRVPDDRESIVVVYTLGLRKSDRRLTGLQELLDLPVRLVLGQNPQQLFYRTSVNSESFSQTLEHVKKPHEDASSHLGHRLKNLGRGLL